MEKIARGQKAPADRLDARKASRDGCLAALVKAERAVLAENRDCAGGRRRPYMCE
jgi:hypothetical protein